MRQPFLQQRLGCFAPHGPSAVSVKRSLAVGEMAYGQIKQHIGRTGVKRSDGGLRASPPIDRANIADAAEVVYADVLSAPTENYDMKDRRQRCALSAGREIGRPKVADDRNAQRLDEIRRLAQLKRRRILCTWVMEDRLAVQSDKVRSRLAENLFCGAGIEPSEIVVQLSDLITRRSSTRRLMQLLLQRMRELHLPVLHQPN